MVWPVMTKICESPESMSKSDRECLRPLYLKRIGEPKELKKLLEELIKVNELYNPTSTGLNFLKTGKDKEDHISRLPNDILQFIIARLDMKEGAATSILSTRWRYLWSTSASCLNFDESNVLGFKYPYELDPAEHELKESLRTDFIKQVDHICQLHCASKMDTFRVSFPFYGDSAGHIDKWMELAAAQGVTRLILDFHPRTRTHIDDPRKYEFPFRIFGSSLRYLDLRSCTIQFHPNFQGLKFLVTLMLCDCFLTDKDMQNILSNCDSLWCLSLRGCKFPDPILKFVGPSIQIKHLRIANCDVKEIKLHDINLLSFELVVEEGQAKLSINNAPHLVRLVLDTIEPVEILDTFPRLETLHLRREEGELLKLSAFKNLRRLVFTEDGSRLNLFDVIYLLEAWPLLQQLEIEMCFAGVEHDGENDSELDRLSAFEGLSSKICSKVGCPHNNLKEVIIYGFNSHPEIMKLIIYLLANATVLEKMVINRESKIYKGNGIHYWSDYPSRLVGMSLEEVCKLLDTRARPSTQILIL